MTKRRFRKDLVASACLALLTVGGASAQSLDTRLPTERAEDPRRTASGGARVTMERSPEGDRTGESDIFRLAPAYNAQGVRVRDFIISPFIEAGGRYNSNIYAQPRAAQGDFVVRTTAAVLARSDTPVHALNFGARIDSYNYATFGRESRVDGSIFANGRYDITRDTAVYAGSSFLGAHEDRGSADDRNGRFPTRTLAYVMEGGSMTRMGRFTLAGDVQAIRREFLSVEAANGTSIRNELRNRWELISAVRGAYELNPGYAVIIRAEGNIRTYDSRVDARGFNRNSTGFRVETGIGVDLSQLVRADFLVGYLQQNYEDARLRSPSGFAMRAVLNWTPSRLTVVAAQLERSVAETITAASSIQRTSAAVLVRHELARNIVLTGTGSIGYDEFVGIARRDVNWDLRGRVTYAFTQNYYVSGEAGFRQRASNDAAFRFNEGLVGFRFGFRL